ncbi:MULTISPECIES: hypothetical protein [unclassified Janthinobacterium]|uniref:hypothetical protein n=1 Tax=unclassified Janthinobacterium TaxID=2610881 RepID=UPI002712CA77|nr:MULTISPECIES: hypothetical protein [unclassified Janthinobacterium]MDO8065266.1 hypothetical protein [Janthinobacterium sp. SUN206]MDO8071623.1 hypothetical protein [Janthinobacterium sp. SUN176]
MKSQMRLAAMTVSLLSASASALAQTPNRCPSLAFYGNAAASGLCKSLSPATQNLQVCELTAAQPDVHLTFGLLPNGVNPPTPLHLTVRTQANNCEQATNIVRNAAGAFVAQNNALLCGVNPVSYVQRMNAQAIVPGANGQSACRTAFINAQAGGKLTPAVAQSYLNACNTGGAANAACP